MNVVLYSTSSPKNKVTKSLSGSTTITGEPHEVISDIEFSIRFSISQLATIKTKNYAYFADTGKYCYLSPNYDIDGQTVIAHFKEDVLMTNASAIRNQTCTISRNEKLSNAYLYDNAYQLKTYEIVSTRKFPHGLTDESIILMTIG